MRFFDLVPQVVYTHTQIHTHRYTHIHLSAYVCMHVDVHVYIYVTKEKVFSARNILARIRIRSVNVEISFLGRDHSG